MTRFTDPYDARVAAGKFVCVGLDPDYNKLPDFMSGKNPTADIDRFLCGIIDATHEFAAAYKPQSAFFEEFGSEGMAALERVILYIRQVAPDVPVILDYKRADIGNTNAGYVTAAFDRFDVDAVTLHPYLAMEAMRPFLDRADRSIFVLCRTSNPGAGELQDVETVPFTSMQTGKLYSTGEEARREGDDGALVRKGSMPYYQFLAHRVAQSWNYNSNVGVVVGATYPQELGLVREIVGDMPILVPGLGSQGGSLREVLDNGLNSRGWGVVLNNASAINFAFSRLMKDGELMFAPEQYGEAAGYAAGVMNEEIQTALHLISN